MAEPDRQIFLVLGAQAGDRAALDALLRSVQSPLFGYLRSLVGDTHLAEDALQDVFVLICRKLRWLRDPALFRPWAYRIASRRAFRLLRKERRRATQPLPHDAHEPEAPPPPGDGAFLTALTPHLPAISPASRAVLSLHYLQTLSLQETADILGIPLGTAKSRLGYGLRALRLILGDTSSRTSKEPSHGERRQPE